MAVVIKRVQVADTASLNSNVRLYTLPAGKRAIVRSIYQGYDGGVVDASMSVAFNGAGFLWDQKVSNQDHRVWPMSTVLVAGNYLDVSHSQRGMYTMAQIVEMDEADFANPAQVHIISASGSGSAYTVPAGKRFRIRELVVTNHGDRSDVSVYITGQGHLAKIEAQPRVGNVIGMNMVASAGEQIGHTVSGPAVHYWLSGVLEDV